MIKTFTQEELIKYVYDEVTSAQKQQIELALHFDEELREKCADLIMAKEAVEKVRYTPGNRAIGNILAYSRMLNASQQ